MIARIRQSLDLETIFKTTAIELRSLLKADRVGVFRFYPELDWEGEFVSEDVDEGWISIIRQEVNDYHFIENFSPLYSQSQAKGMADIYLGNLDESYLKSIKKFQVRANIVAPSQLNQVFMNILSNGIDALQEMCDFHNSSGKTPTIHIRTNVILDRVVICITDNGPGIPEDMRSRIFDPFFTTKAIGKGTGLGLSISYQIVVEKHKGQLQCVSDRDRGTEFWIEIPIKQ